MFTIDKNRCVNCGACVSTCPMAIFHRDKEGHIAVRDGKCLDCFHCTAICPTGAVTHDEWGAASLPVSPTDNSMAAKFRRRRSIRHFKTETPSRETIQKALDGAAYAPSAKNARPYGWTVVLGREKVDDMYRTVLEWAKDQPDFRHLIWVDRRGGNPVTCGAPCLVLVHAPDGSTYPDTDSVIAMTLAEQLLNDDGLGTCWGGYFHRASQQCEALQAKLNIPEGHRVYGVLMVGYPDERFPRDPVRPAAWVNWVE